ncbi:MAG: hypothetical protein MJZ38_03420 [archaeon]|nr:hypothetical protein [archaeon]
MKTRFAAIAVLAVFVVTCFTPLLASEADAVDVDYTKYYYNQLGEAEKNIYGAYSGITGNPTGSADAYVYEVTVTGGAAYTKEQAERAWEASRLDNPYAFWTWTVGTCAPNLEVAAVGGDLKVTIHMDNAYVDAADKCTSAKNVIDVVELKGKDESERVKSANSVLADKKYKLTDDGVGNVSGVLGDDTHSLTAEGFAAVLKALCDREVDGLKVGCIQVYGMLSHGATNKVHAWNQVSVNSQIYAVDPAVNNDKGAETCLCAGNYTVVSGEAFAKEHRAFTFNAWMGLGYAFGSEPLCNGGYEWPEDTSLVAQLVNYAPWILVGIISVVLAVSLVAMARREQ